MERQYGYERCRGVEFADVLHGCIISTVIYVMFKKRAGVFYRV